jgi:hypothetical protein
VAHKIKSEIPNTAAAVSRTLRARRKSCHAIFKAGLFVILAREKRPKYMTSLALAPDVPQIRLRFAR